jgi:hypothetical protein
VVWYVNNSGAAAGNGEAAAPFNTLAAANAAAGANRIIFLYQGNAAYTGGVTLHPGEDLYGQPHGLTVGRYSLVPPGGSPPAITNDSGDGIDLAADTDVEGVNVTCPSGNGIAASNVSDATVGATTPVAISGAGGDGISIAGGDGNLNFGTTGVTTGTNSVTFSNNALNSNGEFSDGSVVISPYGNSHTAITIEGNNIQYPAGDGIGIDEDGTSGTLTGTVRGNIVGTLAGYGDDGGDGIGISAEGSGTATLAITGNDLNQYGSPGGIHFLDQEGNPAMNLTITGNLFTDPVPPNPYSSQPQPVVWGILGQDGALTSDNGTVCAVITGNSIVGSGAAGASAGGDIELEQNDATTLQLPGYTGGNSDIGSIESFLEGDNNVNGTPTASATVSGSGGGFAGGSSC